MRHLADFYKIFNGNMYHYIQGRNDASLKRTAVNHFFFWKKKMKWNRSNMFCRHKDKVMLHCNQPFVFTFIKWLKYKKTQYQ